MSRSSLLFALRSRLLFSPPIVLLSVTSRPAVQYLRKRTFFPIIFWQEERSSASCGLCNDGHLCRVVGFHETSPRLFTIHHRRPCRPSPSVHSKAHEEQCASARIWCRGQGSSLGFGLHPHPLVPRHCLRLRKERSLWRTHRRQG